MDNTPLTMEEIEKMSFELFPKPYLTNYNSRQGFKKGIEVASERDQSRIAELEREKKNELALLLNIAELKQNNETLMGLLEIAVKHCAHQEWMQLPANSTRNILNSQYVSDFWQSYCREHKLKIDTDGK